jgi:hypothetical protein
MRCSRLKKENLGNREIVVILVAGISKLCDMLNQHYAKPKTQTK